MLYFKYSIVTLFSLSLLFILTGYLRLLRFYYAAKKMQEVRHKLLKQIVLRFTNCCRLNIAICNTGVFVKKYIAAFIITPSCFCQIFLPHSALVWISQVFFSFRLIFIPMWFIRFCTVSCIFLSVVYSICAACPTNVPYWLRIISTIHSDTVCPWQKAVHYRPHLPLNLQHKIRQKLRKFLTKIRKAVKLMILTAMKLFFQ